MIRAIRPTRPVLPSLALGLLLALAAGCSKTEPAASGNGPAVDDFHARVRQELAGRSWRDYRDYTLQLDRPTIEKSLQMGIDFMLANQKPAGNFNYEYDWIKRRQNPSDNQVRQAGAVWGLALVNMHRPADRTRRALFKAWDYFFAHSRTLPDGSRMITYPKMRQSDTGTNALIALSLIDFLRSDSTVPDARRAELEKVLDGFLKHLVNMRLDNGHFARHYSLTTGSRSRSTSPYYDGEALLALTKAAKYVGRTDLIPRVEESAAALARTYTFAWKKDGRPDRTKGFYQWGTMSFWEYQDANWKDAEIYRDVIMLLAHWMVRTHRTLRRTRNTAYAHEGLIHAYALARSRGDELAASELRRTTDKALRKLMSWQVGGPLAHRNPFLVDHPTDDPLALGGFMNHRNQDPHTRLRIDVTQHQTHAMCLALQYIYTR